jgi:type I restriction enzyme S subunit
MVITDVEGVFHNNFFLVDYYKKQVNKIYLFYYLNLPWIQEEVKALAGTTTIPDLNHGDFYSLKFLKPPFPEQHRIALILSQIDETIKKEQNYKQKLERIKQGVMEDLLSGQIRVNHLIKEGAVSV